MRTILQRLITLSLALLAGGAACGGDPGATHEPNEVAYSLDLSTYQPARMPPLMHIANQTLVFPLAVGPQEQAPTDGASGDLQRVDTRIGCWIEPEAWIGAQGAVPVHVASAAAPVRMIQLTVDHAASSSVVESLDSLAAHTCVSIRSGGIWRAFHAPSRIVTTVDSAHTEFALDGADGDAVAIFLPTYTYLSKITYRIARD